MQKKWVFVIGGAAALLAAFVKPPYSGQAAVTGETMRFALADMRQSDIAQWRALIERCESAPDRPGEFQHYSGRRSEFYFNRAERMLCTFRDDMPVNVYLADADLPRTHEFSVGTANGRPSWTFGRIPRRNR